jgi:hypothetical protein
MSVITRSLSLLFLAASIALAIAAMTSLHFVVDSNVRTYDQQVYFGLQDWKATWEPSSGYVSTGSQSYSSSLYDQLGLDVYLDSESDWKDAGMAALALGALGVAFAGIGLLIVLASFCRPTATYLSTFPSFLSGFCFILGAVIYEGVRPSFHGDMGYKWAFGLYLTSGILSDLAAYSLHAGSGSDLSIPPPAVNNKV